MTAAARRGLLYRGGITGVVGATSIAAAVAGMLVLPGTQIKPEDLLFLLAVASLVTVGSVLAVRVPTNVVGWLLLVPGSLLAWAGFGESYALRSFASSDGQWPATALAAWVGHVMFVAPILLVIVGLPLVFPDGRLISPRWRLAVAALAAGIVMSMLPAALQPGPIGDWPVDNPVGLAEAESLLETIGFLGNLTVGILLLVAIGSVTVRLRRGHPQERQQLKWLVAATVVGAAAFLAASVADAAGADAVAIGAWFVGFLAITGLPVAIGVAVLRYRLYEIDRLISRTISWALVTGLLVAIFAAGVVAIQALLSGVTQGQTLAVAASTLIAFALFQPLRRRLQSAVDRRFDRARYDGERTIDAFARRLRDETDIQRLTIDVKGTARSAVAPASFSIWLRGGGGAP